MSGEGEEDGTASIDRIHEEMESSPHYPYNLQSGWLPAPGSKSLQKFHALILEADRIEYAPSVQALADYVNSNEIIGYLMDSAFEQNLDIIDAHLAKEEDGVPIPRIPDLDTLLHAFNTILTMAPGFVDDDLVGVPFSAIVVGIDPTLSGVTLFSLPMFNERMSAILREWAGFLGTDASNVGFRVDGEQWLSDAAKKQYDFPIWKKDSETLPYWKSWNSFFTREFADPAAARPIADPDSNMTVICPNDGSLFRWQDDVAAHDVFWFKDMRYSLANILSSPDPGQQAIIDEHNLVEIFTGGKIFQTYLNPYNYHRWWVPVNGTIMFTPFAIPGFYFNKLVIPDFGGATTASLPYLSEVNARGLIVFETDFGRVCCIPLGMSEISSIEFDRSMVGGATVRKGDEMGRFNYGGSSFAVIYEALPGFELSFEGSDGTPYPKKPVLPKGSSGHGANVTNIGAQIGRWLPIADA
jgi:phosphatidylserine decarboxylase